MFRMDRLIIGRLAGCCDQTWQWYGGAALMQRLYCADCSKSLWYVHYREGYVCGNYYRYVKHVCSQHSVQENKLLN
ncbi:recombinase zinc beta ribbon domain-containing protein [Paenibacillus sp. UMB4589-SE434]|uniref:recombinase zinc beta ribbon domain-containing protein n=1 Tax=Paenibacillus sp. UMB4589-SE434 TaxID=3046314 RepID=UPI003312FB6C